MIISVEQKHIKNGHILDCSYCPIAMALRDSGFMFPRVLSEQIEANDGYGRKTYFLSRSAHRFIRAFDAGKPVKPFRFKLEEVHAD